MNGLNMEVDVDLTEFENKCRQMEKLKDNFPIVCAKMMNAINKEVKKSLQKESRSRGYNRQHNFYRGIFAHAGFKDKTRDYRHLFNNAGIGKPKGERGKYKYYANTIEHGAFINSDKPFKVLIDGEWKTLKMVYIPSSPFVKRIVRSWYGGKGDAIMDKEAQKIIARYGLQ